MGWRKEEGELDDTVRLVQLGLLQTLDVVRRVRATDVHLSSTCMTIGFQNIVLTYDIMYILLDFYLKSSCTN